MPKPGPYYVINNDGVYSIGDPSKQADDKSGAATVLRIDGHDIEFAYRVADALNAYEGRGPTTPR